MYLRDLLCCTSVVFPNARTSKATVDAMSMTTDQRVAGRRGTGCISFPCEVSKSCVPVKDSHRRSFCSCVEESDETAFACVHRWLTWPRGNAAVAKPASSQAILSFVPFFMLHAPQTRQAIELALKLHGEALQVLDLAGCGGLDAFLTTTMIRRHCKRLVALDLSGSFGESRGGAGAPPTAGAFAGRRGPGYGLFQVRQR